MRPRQERFGGAAVHENVGVDLVLADKVTLLDALKFGDVESRHCSSPFMFLVHLVGERWCSYKRV